jgi:hypothetical protein
MTRVLIAWEDQYFQTLGPFVKKRVTARAPAGAMTFPELLFHTAHSNGGFKRYAASLGKNAPGFDDVLRDLARDDLSVVVERVPDIDRLSDLIWQLASPPPPGPPRAPDAPSAPPGQGPSKKKPRRPPKR